MHNVVFASIEFDYDFDTEDEAKAFVLKNMDKKWWWDSREPQLQRNGKWSLRVRKPYKDYNPGW